jgi:light-harvesting complex I chlorophyll a/b binding protein 1
MVCSRLVSILVLEAAAGFAPKTRVMRAFLLRAENSNAFPFLKRPEKLDGG